MNMYNCLFGTPAVNSWTWEQIARATSEYNAQMKAHYKDKSIKTIKNQPFFGDSIDRSHLDPRQ